MGVTKKTPSPEYRPDGIGYRTQCGCSEWTGRRSSQNHEESQTKIICSSLTFITGRRRVFVGSLLGETRFCVIIIKRASSGGYASRRCSERQDAAKTVRPSRLIKKKNRKQKKIHIKNTRTKRTYLPARRIWPVPPLSRIRSLCSRIPWLCPDLPATDTVHRRRGNFPVAAAPTVRCRPQDRRPTVLRRLGPAFLRCTL